ncbi:NEAT domain-containing protein [Siminovitchia sp. 179-K 8D1 HS]|uniref:NEAT domain-containing protein n=1 Tax=Siminovitchia sp. 179-K 8D1 HS TaxID=3142385 RepID=UPI0039A008DB
MLHFHAVLCLERSERNDYKDEEKDTKVVEFEVSDLDQILNAKVHIIVPFINYDNKYDIRFKFDPSKMELQNVENKPEPIHLEDGNYTIDLEALHAKEDKPSGMARYIEKTASLAVKGGKTLLTLTLTDHKTVTGFQVEGKQPVTEDVNEAKNTRAVTYELDQLTTLMNAQVQYTAGAHNGDQPLRLAFNEDSVTPADEEEEEEDGDTDHPKYADGVYKLPFVVWQAAKDEQSVADEYFEKPAQLIIEDGKYTVQAELKNSSWWQYFKVQSGNDFVDVTTVSEDVKKGTRIVKFKVDDLDQILNAKVHIIVTGIPGLDYDNKYDIRFKFDPSEIPLSGENPGEEPGENPGEEPGENPGEEPGENPGGEPGQKPGEEDSKYKDGVYTLPFVVWKDKENVSSVADGYFVKPATVKIEKGKYTVQATLKNGSWWKSFQTAFGNKFKEVKTVSENKKDDTRIVQFPVEDLDKILNGKVHIIVKGIPGFEYDNKYDIRFKFHSDQLKLIQNDDNGFVDDSKEPIGEDNNGNNSNNGNQNGNNNGQNGSNENKQNQAIDPRNLKDGEYSIEYKVLKYNTNQTSVMNDYVVSPGHLKVKDGKKRIAITLKNSSWITDLKVNRQGKLAAPTVLSTDTKADTRIVEFEVDDLFKKLDAWVKVDFDIPGLSYHNEYDVQFAFDPNSIKLLKPGEIYPPKGKVEEAKQKPNEETKSEQSNEDNVTVPAFDRNGDKINKNNSGITNKLGINPKTADKAKIILFATLLMGSLLFLIIKWRRKTDTNR